MEEKETNQLQVVLIIPGYWLSGLMPRKLSTSDQKTQRNTITEEAEFKPHIKFSMKAIPFTISFKS